MISIRQAAASGIDRVREPHWFNKMDHLKIDIIDGKPGPWAHLYSPINAMLDERDPQDIPLWPQAAFDEQIYEPYTGPLPDSDDYRKAVAQFSDVKEKGR